MSTRYETWPARGGYASRCDECHRQHHDTADGIRAWQRNHTCQAFALAAVTRAKAARILADLISDDLDVVTLRRAQAVAEAYPTDIATRKQAAA